MLFFRQYAQYKSLSKMLVRVKRVFLLARNECTANTIFRLGQFRRA